MVNLIRLVIVIGFCKRMMRKERWFMCLSSLLISYSELIYGRTKMSTCPKLTNSGYILFPCSGGDVMS